MPEAKTRSYVEIMIDHYENGLGRPMTPPEKEHVHGLKMKKWADDCNK